MNFFEQQHRTLTNDAALKSYDCRYIGRACFIPIREGRLARLDFVTDGTRGKYEGLEINILSASQGRIDTLRLRFVDFFTKKSFGNGAGETIPFIWEDDRKTIWYAEPTSSEIKALSRAVKEYIDLFA